MPPELPAPTRRAAWRVAVQDSLRGAPAWLYALLTLTLLVLWIGLWPAPLIEVMDASVAHLLHQAQLPNLRY